jgi:predicted transcriptional regulator
MVVKQNATLRDAAEILLKHELAAAPVVDHEGRMVGVLSESDLLRVFSDDSQQSMRVQHAMRASVVGFSEDTSLQEIFDFVVRVSIPQVVIVRDGKPCGVVGRQALLSLLFSQGFGDDQLTQPQATASSLPATIPLTPPPAPGATVPGPASTV